MHKIFRRLLLIIIFILFVICTNYLKSLPLYKEIVEFKSCIDGDTAIFVINEENKTVRFIAIDAPENNTEIGKEVSNYVCKALKDASTITLEYEVNATTDKYNRVLAWVYVDDKLIQKDLIEKGYAQVKYIYDDYKYVDELEKIQEQVKKEKLGIWK